MKRSIIVLLVFSFALSLQAKDFYVSKATGNNGNKGTKEAPMKNIQKALKKAKAGDKVFVAEGNYYGMRDKGFIEMKAPVELYGGYSADFSKRDVVKYKTLIQPTNATGKKSRKPLLTVTKSKKGVKIVIDGFIFDMGARNAYHKKDGQPEGVITPMLQLPPKFDRKLYKTSTVTKQCLTVKTSASAGDMTIQNNAFLNCAFFAIQAGHKKGEMKILNNVFVANRMAAIEIFGTGGKKGPKGPTHKDGNVEFAYNTVLFTWSRLKDFGDMGYGFRVRTKLSYNIHHNIIGASVFAGIDHSFFNKGEWLKIDNNVLGLSKKGDLQYSEESNTTEFLKVAEWEDLEFASISGNSGKMPKLPINKAYLTGFLNASYSETAEFNPDSASNQFRAAMGMNKRGKLTSKVTMFGNRYPVEDAMKLFGATKGVGAQTAK